MCCFITKKLIQNHFIINILKLINIMKRKITQIFIGVTVLLSVGCFSKKVMVERYAPIYQHTPTERAEVNSTGLTIALISPQYGDKKMNKTAPYSNFSKNMGDDFEELLIAKGFTIRGPYASRDEMVYSDKEDTDIALIVDIDMEIENESLTTREKAGIPFLKTDYVSYQVSGTFHQEGDITLTAVSPFKGEKLWKKQIALDRRTITCTGEDTWELELKGVLPAMKDNGIYNPTAKALEEYYQEVMTTATKHLDVREMKQVAAQAKKADEDSRN